MNEIIDYLDELIPDAVCELNYNNVFELLIATCLAAQATDVSVNKVTGNLFSKYNNAQSLMEAKYEDVVEIIKTVGLSKTKAKNIIALSKKLYEDYQGEVPCDFDYLITLPGVGRKTANVVMLEAFNNPQGVAVDTHCKRISNRIGLSKETDPLKIEKDLLKQFSKEYYYDLNHMLIWHGRNTCTARNPKCDICPISNLCKTSLKNK